jgi:hypothetical protein
MTSGVQISIPASGHVENLYDCFLKLIIQNEIQISNACHCLLTTIKEIGPMIPLTFALYLYQLSGRFMGCDE